ncbi:hypothetical protein [Shouchella clausii]|uniref:hypothetical protein n=1 Tax=Shouchella clausii TaxID=79880 RepID=UPI000BA63065|nr:hypothetical protein [Shouchella clausii]PAD13449.1 hypothetical protein CHH74_11445 [Shouchella clausii]
MLFRDKSYSKEKFIDPLRWRYVFIIHMSCLSICNGIYVSHVWKNTPYARFVENFYEPQPKDWYDKFMNFFYIMNYGVAHRGYVKVMEKHGGIKGKLRYAGFVFL